jgi:DNA-binding Xre family transcriptional regulator
MACAIELSPSRTPRSGSRSPARQRRRAPPVELPSKLCPRSASFPSKLHIPRETRPGISSSPHLSGSTLSDGGKAFKAALRVGLRPILDSFPAARPSPSRKAARSTEACLHRQLPSRCLAATRGDSPAKEDEMKAKGPVNEEGLTGSPPMRRRKRSGLRPALRARLLAEVRDDESLADQFRRLLVREMDQRKIREADLAREWGCSLENIVQIFDGGKGLRFDTAERLCRSIGLRIVLSLKEQRVKLPEVSD